MMSLLFAFLPLLLMPVIYASLLKVSAWLLRRIQLRWRDAFTLALMGIAVGVLGSVLNNMAGQWIPAVLVGLTGIVAQLALGGWYLGPRAMSAGGTPIGFGRGVLLALLPIGIVFVVGIVAGVMVPVWQHARQA